MLKSVDLPIVNNEKCREMHRGNLRISSNKICAGGRRNEGVCEVKEKLIPSPPNEVLEQVNPGGGAGLRHSCVPSYADE